MTSRRNFLLSAATAVAASAQVIRPDSASGKLAERELLRGLTRLDFHSAAPQFALRLEKDRFRNPEAYEIRRDGSTVVLSAPNDQALLFAVFEFLERQGAIFGIDGESYPLDAPKQLTLPRANEVWSASPRFAVRGLLPWPDFLNCITVYNEEDFRAYFEAMLRMRLNTFGMHVYTGAKQWTESYLPLEFAGAGQISFLDTSATHRWGYLPQRTSKFTMGGAQFYDGEIFGNDSTRAYGDQWEAASRVQSMLRKSFDHAKRLGIRTGIGFEPYQIPDEILRALPPEARKKAEKEEIGHLDVESRTAGDLLETRLAALLETYPDVDYVWLWEDENANWESRKSGVPISATPFLQAHAFLKRNAPNKRLVVSGWGGVARHFDSLHQRLPEDIVFSCLSDTLGWDPVNDVFGKLEGRERWPIPWLEDDPSMWLPQLHVNRFERDMNLAEQYGCQGLLGIHWRHRIVDPTAIYQARFSWDKSLTPDAHFAHYAGTQASGPRAEKLGRILAAADKDEQLLATSTGEVKDGHVVQREWSGDYTEGFTFWNQDEPPLRVMQSQAEVAQALRALVGEAANPVERERLAYLTGNVEFLVAYTEAWQKAHRLNAVLEKAGKEKTDAALRVSSEGVPLWLELAPLVRQAMLDFESVVATRNDLGTLASLHNKFVRLALVRLRLSMKEYLGELPPQVEELYAQVILPDPHALSRLVVPTRPTMLKAGESVRLTIIAPGAAEPGPIVLRTRLSPVSPWLSTPAKLRARRTYEARLGPFPASAKVVDYRVDPRGEVYKLTMM
jgi:hypothetical protein